MDLLPGFIQGLTRVSISYPFDTIKIYMQKNHYKNTYDTLKNIFKVDPKILYRGSSLTYTIIPIDRSIQFYLAEKYKNKINPFILSSLLGILTTIYNLPLQYLTANIVLTKKENYSTLKSFIKQIEFKNLYRGLSVELPKTIISTSTYMGSYYYLREKYNRDNNIYYAPIIGIISSLISWSIIFPFDTIRNDIQTTNKNLNETIIYRYKNYGLKNFYKGITPVFIRTIPSSACGMLTYEITRNYIQKYKSNF